MFNHSSTPVEIGQLEALFRYPIKSMGGEELDAVELGWHGLDGDRRLAFHRINDHGGFPWLTAVNLPAMVLFSPRRLDSGAHPGLPSHVHTPEGLDLPVLSDELDADIGRRFGRPVKMMHLKNGIFDDASISLIATATVDEVTRLAGLSPDVRRFRPNVLVRCEQPASFQEDEWVGGTISFGDADDAPAIAVTSRDLRCSLVNLDPDSARPSPQVLKAVVKSNQNNAGIYGTVTRVGQLVRGQKIFLRKPNGSL